jgi:hypothetical protein
VIENKFFYPYTYIWIYTYPELAGQLLEIQNNFQHILQFEDNQNFDKRFDQPILTKRRGRPIGRPNRQDSWKNTAAPEWKPTKKIEVPWDPNTIATLTNSKNDVNSVHFCTPNH